MLLGPGDFPGHRAQLEDVPGLASGRGLELGLKPLRP